MLKKIHKNRRNYTAFLRRYIYSLLLVCITLIAVIGSSFYYKSKKKEKFQEVKYLISDLREINENVETQVTDGYINIHDIFLNFGDFQDQTAKFVGVNDLEIIDSLSRIGSVVKYFDIDGEEKHKIEILHFSDKIDDLLLNTDEQSLFIKAGQNNREVTQEGKNFISSWFRFSHLLERSFVAEQHDLELKLANYKNRIYITCLFFIAILIGYVTLLYFVVYYRILKSIKVLRTNSRLLTEGKKPKSLEGFLIGETAEIQSRLKTLYNDYTQTEKMLTRIYSDDKMKIEELKKHKDNVFFDSIQRLFSQIEHIETTERDRTWTNNGIKKLTDVVNKLSTQPKLLFETYLQTLVKYLGAVQGGFFIKETEQVLSLETSYAYDRLKKATRTINKGEGIIGEVWEEEKTLYVENVSSEHFSIKSSLGEAKPVAIIIAPLIERGDSYGVLELASFKTFSLNQRKFIENACDILAGATANVMINQKTRTLLKDSQKLTEKLTTQENEKLQKIKLLTEKIDSEIKKSFQKDFQIKELRFQLNHLNEERTRLTSDINKQKLSFERELEEAVSNSTLIKESKDKIIELEAIKTDLEETLRIRNFKIDKLKKKIANQP